MWIIVGECHKNIYNIVTRSTVIQIMVFKQFLQKNLIAFYVCSIPITKTNTGHKIAELLKGTKTVSGADSVWF